MPKGHEQCLLSFSYVIKYVVGYFLVSNDFQLSNKRVCVCCQNILRILPSNT